MKKTIVVKGIAVSTRQFGKSDFISLTDIAKYKDDERTNYIVQNWMRNRSTIEFLGLWERINNRYFKGIEFDAFKNEAGSNSFSLTPKRWVESTGAVGLVVKVGRYGGGVYAHKDIAFEFASWISAEFKLFLIKEFQRLKEKEIEREKLGWDLKRNLAAINYRIHTDAVKEHLIPPQISKVQSQMIYASEADVLNVALFGKTAKEWRKTNLKKPGNIRDYAMAAQLVCLTNLESFNAQFIKQKLGQSDRLQMLNQIAIEQMKSLLQITRVKLLEEK
ncbi:MAG: DNA-binding protein [Candidatus Chisholmbacteria bacterium RIFCSPHIGHO2_01_FULL_48_12]|uniref:DNA-binding protein n=2 Tax=Patescibacteria group TaxID=1783273 RepID=A0A1G1VQE5_9BACT|nr:MAG: DNA-binding protein [Candidatus Chisholmbacteria bacterium RIFCSPHIGHO2_01_FULL_48_12]OGZ39619.1 MAG: DNA-binding protein [Candidatus Portnoybacteria bacterium RIFCSPLOWO2_02_FULL_40_15]